MSPALVYRTLRLLRPSQIGWRAVHEARTRLYRRIGTLPRLWIRPDPAARFALRRTLPELRAAAETQEVVKRWSAGFVSYHGEDGDRSDWVNAGRTRLWRYERQYHRELPALALVATDTANEWLAQAQRLVADWWRACPPLAGDGWEPYPVARRILNWSIAGAICPELGQALAPLLGPQVRFLAAHLEHHLLGNHLLCDAAALVAGGAALEDAGAEAIAARAARLLERELRRQVLGDGGYAERTTQYHAIVLQDVLCALLLARARGRQLAVENAASVMLAWLRAVVREDGSFPCLNDAALESTPALATLEALSRSAGVAAPAVAVNQATTVLPDTGWTIVRVPGHELLFEHGMVGPEEQPGHGHADTLSYELVWDGALLVSDTGVSTYEASDIRQFERAPGAHASVSVDSEGIDEVWGSFRVGARGVVQPAKVRHCGEATTLLDASAASFRGWTHRRRLMFRPGRALVVVDQVEGLRPAAKALSHIPLHPGWSYTALGSTVDARKGGTAVCLRLLRGGPSWDSQNGWVAEGFGRRRPRPSFAAVGDREGTIIYAFTAPGVTVELDGDRAVIIADGGGACSIALDLT